MSILYHQTTRLQLALDSEVGNIGLDGLANVAVQVDESVPCVQGHAVCWEERTEDNALHVVAASTWGDGLQRGGEDFGTKSGTEELAECAGSTVDGDVGVGILAANVVRELDFENDRSCGGGSWSGESAGEEESSGREHHGGLHFDGWKGVV
jgi:hypothetical protein